MSLFSLWRSLQIYLPQLAASSDSKGESVAFLALHKYISFTHHHLFLEIWMSIHLCLPSTAAAGTVP